MAQPVWVSVLRWPRNVPSISPMNFDQNPAEDRLCRDLRPDALPDLLPAELRHRCHIARSPRSACPRRRSTRLACREPPAEPPPGSPA